MIFTTAIHGNNSQTEICLQATKSKEIYMHIKMNIDTEKELDYESILTIDEAKDIVLALQIAIRNAKIQTL